MANNLYVYKGEIDGDGSITGIAIDWADSVEELCAVAWGVLDYTTVDGGTYAERCVSITDSGYLFKASDGTFTCECPFQSDIKSWEIFIWKKNTELSERDLEEEWKEDGVIPVEGIISDIVSIKDRLREDEVNMSRALRAPEEGGDELIIPPVDVRSGHILGFNSKGQPTVGEDCEAVADFTSAASAVKGLVSDAESAASEAKASAMAAETAKTATEDAAKSAVETITSLTDEGVEKMETLVKESAENASTAESAAVSAAESAKKALGAAAGDVDLSDYVDITTDQKIDGVKSFTGLAAFAQDKDNEASYARWTIKPEIEDGALRFTSEGGNENHFYLKPSSDMEDGDEATIALSTDVARLDAKIDEVANEVSPDAVDLTSTQTITGTKTFRATMPTESGRPSNGYIVLGLPARQNPSSYTFTNDTLFYQSPVFIQGNIALRGETYIGVVNLDGVTNLDQSFLDISDKGAIFYVGDEESSFVGIGSSRAALINSNFLEIELSEQPLFARFGRNTVELQDLGADTDISLSAGIILLAADKGVRITTSELTLSNGVALSSGGVKITRDTSSEEMIELVMPKKSGTFALLSDLPEGTTAGGDSTTYVTLTRDQDIYDTKTFNGSLRVVYGDTTYDVGETISKQIASVVDTTSDQKIDGEKTFSNLHIAVADDKYGNSEISYVNSARFLEGNSDLSSVATDVFVIDTKRTNTLLRDEGNLSAIGLYAITAFDTTGAANDGTRLAASLLYYSGGYSDGETSVSCPTAGIGCDYTLYLSRLYIPAPGESSSSTAVNGNLIFDLYNSVPSKSDTSTPGIYIDLKNRDQIHLLSGYGSGGRTIVGVADTAYMRFNVNETSIHTTEFYIAIDKKDGSGVSRVLNIGGNSDRVSIPTLETDEMYVTNLDVPGRLTCNSLHTEDEKIVYSPGDSGLTVSAKATFAGALIGTNSEGKSVDVMEQLEYLEQLIISRTS